MAMVPSPGIDATTGTQASNSLQTFVILQPFEKRSGKTLRELMATMEQRVSGIIDADIRVLQQPPVRGIGTAGGFKMVIEDRGKQGYAALDAAVKQVIAAASKGDTAVGRAFTSFSTTTPRIDADIDREKAEILGVDDAQVFSSLQTYLASSYINDFNYLGRTYQVRAQADWPFRQSEADLGEIRVRTASGGMAPLASFVTLERTTGPYRAPHYNLFPSAELQGSPAPGRSTGEALADMEKLARENLPPGFSYEWTEIAYQQTSAGNTGMLVFGMAVVFAFLVLAALYESLTLPVAVLLIVPMCLLAAMFGVNIRGLDNNILTQVGLIVLVGLAAKNAILIVEFAKQDEDNGATPEDAAVGAARTRLRPILMTSFAFILGVVPLAFASGAGAEMRQALGVSVFFGMIGVTVFGLIFTPAFYVASRRLSGSLIRLRGRFAKAPKSEAAE
jgi:multidrug efflux pump subunit AcrB